jgi:hypothetical protein
MRTSTLHNSGMYRTRLGDGELSQAAIFAWRFSFSRRDVDASCAATA